MIFNITCNFAVSNFHKCIKICYLIVIKEHQKKKDVERNLYFLPTIGNIIVIKNID